MKEICIDIDNVLAKSDTIMREIISRQTNNLVNLEYKDIIEFDYYKCKDKNSQCISKEEWHNIHEEFSKPENILRIEPYLDVSNFLKEAATKYSIFILTSRLEIAKEPTVQWLKKHDIFYNSIDFVKHRSKHLNPSKFEFVIEDDYGQAKLFAESNMKCFLISHPWNLNKEKMKNIFWINNVKEIETLIK